MFEENLRACQVYIACNTQIRRGFDGSPTGLDYPGVESVMRIMGIENNQKIFSKLQVMEGEMLKVVRERREKKTDG